MEGDVFRKLLAPKHYRVERISFTRARTYIWAHHYTHSSHNGPSPCYGLFKDRQLIGVVMFATSCSEAVRRSIFGPGNEDQVTELHRLHVLDVTPRFIESWFVAQCFKRIAVDRPQTRGVIEYSDPTAGHWGTVYQAVNALYLGMTSGRWFYRDQAGRLRHPRQNGKNISRKQAEAMGWVREWRLGKHKYLSIIGRRNERKVARKMLRAQVYPYPFRQMALLFQVQMYLKIVWHNLRGEKEVRRAWKIRKYAGECKI